ncbi:E3 ubiquitin-protein ligase rad18 [Oleoguttula sp. CCFEE 5521]
MSTQLSPRSMDSIPDSTDWLGTPLSSLADVENALHCQICKEFYDTPMITSCHHTFCSKCIRTSLSADGRCPACRASDQATRPATLKVAREEREVADGTRRGKRKRAVLDSYDVADVAEEGRTTRRKSRRLAASQTSQPDAITVDDSEEDGSFEPEAPLDDGLVECPLGCGKRMKIDAVEPHLDRCEEEQEEQRKAKLRPPTRLAPRTAPNAQDRISEPNYSMLNDIAMRKKLKEFGLSSAGVKQLMIRRYTEWVNLWNANCDSSSPRSKRELMHDLDTWERTQGGKAHTPVVANSVMKKDFDGAGWANSNKDDFSRLIADARKKRPSPASGAATPEPSDGAAPATVIGSVTGDPVESAQLSNQNAEHINGDRSDTRDLPHESQTKPPLEQASSGTTMLTQPPSGQSGLSKEAESYPSVNDASPRQDLDPAPVTQSLDSSAGQLTCAPQVSPPSSPNGKTPSLFAIATTLGLQRRGETAMEFG